MTTIAPSDVPHGRLDWKHGENWVILTALRAGSEDLVTVEMPFGQWCDLPLVQYVVKVQLSRQQPRRPRDVTNDPAGAPPVPRGHIEWKDGQNWVVLTAHRVDSQEVATLEMTLAQWFACGPVRWAVEERLRRWQEHKYYWQGGGF